MRGKLLLSMLGAISVVLLVLSWQPVSAKEGLMDPSALNQRAPDKYRAKFETSEGNFVIEVTREWAPLGADRFYNLVANGFYDGTRFFRVIRGFVAQFGINGDPAVSKVWREATIADDPVVERNLRGTITFATSGKNSRTTQVFINFADNTNLDKMGFAPFGRVVEGMDVVDRLYKDYADAPPRGNGPNQSRIQQEGNKYLIEEFPELDHTKKATIVPAPGGKS